LRDLQEYNDQELIELAASEVRDRKKAIAEEILQATPAAPEVTFRSNAETRLAEAAGKSPGRRQTK